MAYLVVIWVRSGLNDATVTDWNPSPDSPFALGINTLIAADDRISVAGDFANIAGNVRNQLAAFDAKTGGLLAWDARIAFLFSTVETIAISSNAVYIGGNFTALGNQPRSHIDAVDKITGNALPWNPFIRR